MAKANGGLPHDTDQPVEEVVKEYTIVQNTRKFAQNLQVCLWLLFNTANLHTAYRLVTVLQAEYFCIFTDNYAQFIYRNPACCLFNHGRPSTEIQQVETTHASVKIALLIIRKFFLD